MAEPVFLFDLDGTLADTMPWHLKTWEDVVADLGGTLKGDALMQELYGKGAELMQRLIPGRSFTESEADEIIYGKEALYRERYGKQIQLLPGTREFLEAAAHRNISMGIGTSSNHPNIEMVLNNLNIRPFFSAIIGAEDVKRGKPDPETWQRLAEALGAAPEHCIVFEDAPKGVEAAAHAGMKAVAITGHYAAAGFAEYENVIRLVPGLYALTLDELY